MPMEDRLRWIEAYEATGSAGLVCARFGISRPTLRKWWRRYQESGPDGLAETSRRPSRLGPWAGASRWKLRSTTITNAPIVNVARNAPA